MTISGNLKTGLTKSLDVQRTYQPQQNVAAQTAKSDFARRFDSVTISGDNSPVFSMEARRQLANEVRTATSSGLVSSLREEIRGGLYQPDSMEIARKMLLIGEVG